jgi:hypothetical protein
MLLLTWAILGVYIAEIVLRVYAYYPKLFFTKWFNLFDFFVVLLSLILLLVENAEAAKGVGAVRGFRASGPLSSFVLLRGMLQTVCICGSKSEPKAGPRPRSVSRRRPALAVARMGGCVLTVRFECDLDCFEFGIWNVNRPDVGECTSTGCWRT